MVSLINGTSSLDEVLYTIQLDVRKRNGSLVADILAVDWFTGDLGGGVNVAGIKEKLGGGVSQFTYGENFSDRAKGFSIAFLAVFPSQTELEAADPNQEENFNDYIDGTFGLDFVVPSPPR
ncbi:hypothetical protein PanWU01x14_260920 [Parasponia andersonii]|uniref:Uncharacterized protein n=1 Tax=Parasponia andersonii TaxID=3476 RepID=A0A2P5B8N4_PARAD|nr:hypothetical protein PanWU01x14_260920 [Parasponia andersonii]